MGIVKAVVVGRTKAREHVWLQGLEPITGDPGIALFDFLQTKLLASNSDYSDACTALWERWQVFEYRRQGVVVPIGQVPKAMLLEEQHWLETLTDAIFLGKNAEGQDLRWILLGEFLFDRDEFWGLRLEEAGKFEHLSFVRKYLQGRGFSYEKDRFSRVVSERGRVEGTKGQQEKHILHVPTMPKVIGRKGVLQRAAVITRTFDPKQTEESFFMRSWPDEGSLPSWRMRHPGDFFWLCWQELEWAIAREWSLKTCSICGKKFFAPYANVRYCRVHRTAASRQWKRRKHGIGNAQHGN